MVWWKSLLIIISIIALLALLLKILRVSTKIIVKLVINSIIGCVILYLVNLIPYINIPINFITTILTGIFGVPFVLIMIIIGLF